MKRSGRVVVLNGTASAGKSSLARAFRLLAPTMWIGMGQDAFAENLVDRWVQIDEGAGERCDGFTFVRRPDGSMHVEVGPVGARLLRSYRHAVAAVAHAGSDVIVDETMFDAAGWEQWRTVLRDVDVMWLRVECDLAVCEERERDRDDRRLLRGLARGLRDRVHAGVVYDAEVDTTSASPEECARAVLDLVEPG